MNITLTPLGNFILFATIMIMLLVNALIAGYAYKAHCAPKSRLNVLGVVVMTLVIPVWGWFACRSSSAK